MAIQMTASERRKQFRELAVVWGKKMDAVIHAPLFKNGVINREADALRQEETEARKRLSDFLDSAE